MKIIKRTTNLWGRGGAIPGALVLATFALAGWLYASEKTSAHYTIWAADQNANIIYILDDNGDVVRSLDVAEMAEADRPHLMAASADGALIFIANTVSNSISIHKVTDGTLVEVVENVGKSPHAAQPNPFNPDRLYVSNIAPRSTDNRGNPDKGETITELIYTGEGWKINRYLDLKNAPALSDDEKFPSRRPVLVGFSDNGHYMVVTLFDGGLAIVDLASWQVIESIGKDQVRHHATVAYPSPDQKELYVGSGNQKESWLYVIDVSGKPKLVATHNLSSMGQDAHGMTIDTSRQELWVVHRASSNITIHSLATIRESAHNPIIIEAGGDTPDMIAISPDNSRAYVTLRGPKPAPTIPFPLTGEKPGVAILDVSERKPVKLFVAPGDPQLSDFHGIVVLPKS